MLDWRAVRIITWFNVFGPFSFFGLVSWFFFRLFLFFYCLVFLRFLLTESKQVGELEATTRGLLSRLIARLRRRCRRLLNLLAETLPKFLGATEEVILIFFLLLWLLLLFNFLGSRRVRDLLRYLGRPVSFQLALHFVILFLNLHFSVYIHMRHNELLDACDDLCDVARH